jgi:hypothetical protein
MPIDPQQRDLAKGVARSAAAIGAIVVSRSRTRSRNRPPPRFHRYCPRSCSRHSVCASTLPDGSSTRNAPNRSGRRRPLADRHRASSGGERQTSPADGPCRQNPRSASSCPPAENHPPSSDNPAAPAECATAGPAREPLLHTPSHLPIPSELRQRRGASFSLQSPARPHADNRLFRPHVVV